MLLLFFFLFFSFLFFFLFFLKVSVRLPHAEYHHVPAIEMQLMVVANLIIDPGDIYLLEGDSVQYRILQVSFVFGRLCFMT